MRRSVVGPVLGLVAALALAACGQGEPAESLAADSDSDGLAGVPLSEPLDKPDVTLVDSAGRPWDLRAETDGHLTFLFFGYTSCPDICPVHMANLTSVFERLPSTVTDHVRVVFVSTDPARDTPERMAEFMSAFDDDFAGVTGDLEDITAAMRALDLPEPVHEDPDVTGFYEVGHPAQLLAFTPEDDRARYAYPWGTRQQDLVNDIPELVSRASAQAGR